MKRLIKISWIILICLVLTSCIDTQEIEMTSIITASGIDLADDESLAVTLVTFQFTPQSQEYTKVLTGEGKTVKGAIENAENSSIYNVASGKIKLAVYGKEMAEKGIIPSLDTAARDASIPDLMYLSVSQTTAKEILSISEDEVATDIGQFLVGLIENQREDHNIPRKTVQDFLRIYYDVGQDNVLPIFEIKEKMPFLSSLALFKGDQMVGELTIPEAILINLMDGTVKEQVFGFSLPLEPFKDYLEKRENRKEEQIVETSFMIKKGKSKTELKDADNLSFQTDTTMQVRLLEQSAGIVFKDKKVLDLMEKEVEKNMEDRFNKLLDKLKKMESDPFGYGRFYHSSEKGGDLTQEEWREKYPKITVQFNVDVEIIRHGVID